MESLYSISCYYSSFMLFISSFHFHKNCIMNCTPAPKTSIASAPSKYILHAKGLLMPEYVPEGGSKISALIHTSGEPKVLFSWRERVMCYIYLDKWGGSRYPGKESN